jgi:hypothetical protein
MQSEGFHLRMTIFLALFPSIRHFLAAQATTRLLLLQLPQVQRSECLLVLLPLS